MKIAGLVCEFNPLHKGHEYIISKIKEDHVDYLVCAMSPNFTMRGEPAIFDKFTRTNIALSKGIDVVFEIPTIYTINSADIYAKAAITILNNAHITDLYFGSEVDDISIYNKVKSITHSNEFKASINKFMKDGNSFNTSYKKAIVSIDPTLEEYMYLPNFLLSLEYIKAIDEINSNINIHIIKRIQANYYDDINKTNDIQSASAIRELLKTGNNVQYLSYNVENYSKHYKEDYFNFIKYKINSSSSLELSEINGISEGIENSIKNNKSNSYNELINSLISKRNRENKINRILFSILLNIKKQELTNINYLRVLGFNENASKYLKSLNNIYTTINRTTDKRILREIDFTKIYDIYDENLELKEYKPIIYKN